MVLAAVRDLREFRAEPSPEELDAYEADLLAEFVLARASAGVLGRVLRTARPATRTGKAASLSVHFEFLEMRHKVAIHAMTGHVVECPLDEVNRPRTSVTPLIRVPPSPAEIETPFTGWRKDLAAARKFAPAARNYTCARLLGDIGLRINKMRMLDLADVRWDLGHFGKLNVRHGKGSRRRGPKQWLVPLINGADVVLRWFIEDAWIEGRRRAERRWEALGQ